MFMSGTRNGIRDSVRARFKIRSIATVAIRLVLVGLLICFMDMGRVCVWLWLR